MTPADYYEVGDIENPLVANHVRAGDDPLRVYLRHAARFVVPVLNSPFHVWLPFTVQNR